MTHVLAGDVGGTRARFTLFDERGKKMVFQDVLESRAFPTFEKALSKFLEGDARKHLKGKRPIAAATFGIAGPVVGHRVHTTNLPWTIDALSVSDTFGIPNVTLLNDLVAVGLGAIASPPSKRVVLQKGKLKAGTGANMAVIAAGTGLGEAAFIWDGEKHVPSSTEGGHVDFAARTPLEAQLLAELTTEYGHVSYERVASGSTISRLYRFFAREVKESKDAAAFVARAPDANVAVVELAEKGESEAAMRALEMWCSVYGAEAGNLALKTMAVGGVFVAGGVSARLAPIFAKGLPARKKKGLSPFVEGFIDKGRMRQLLEKIPVVVSLEPRAGILGAAAHAANMATRKVGRSRKA